MKLAKPKEKKLLDRKFLIPSIIAIGFIPLIVHEHTYRTHIENYPWARLGDAVATDFFLFYKEWATVILALVCLLILLIRAKYFKEKLPWEKKAFIPLLVYGAFVLLSACFAKNHLFAWAGGYEVFQSAPVILSYLVIFYYTYSCIKSEDHVLYLLRGSEWFILIEVVICFSQAIGHDLIATNVGKALISNPSRWNNLDSLSLAGQMYGTMYHNDFLSNYLPVILPITIVLIFAEKVMWRRIFNLGLSVVIAGLAVKGSSSYILAIVGALFAAVLIISARDKKTFAAWCVMCGCLIFATLSILNLSGPYMKAKSKAFWITPHINADETPITKITTGNADEGVTVNLRDGRTIRFTFSISSDNKLTLNVWDGDGNPLEMQLADEASQTMVFTDPKYAADMSFYVDTSQGVPWLVLNQSYGHFTFTDRSSDDKPSGDGYYLISTALKRVKLPEKNPPEISDFFDNGFLNTRGYAYNQTLPLLKKFIFIGAGADNYEVVLPQREYIIDGYMYNNNMLFVKPHCYYMQVWVQEGLIGLAAVLAAYILYIIAGVRLYRKVTIRQPLELIGFGILIGVIAYLVAGFANDSMIVNGSAFWALFGAGWGINGLVKNETKES